MKSVVGGRNSDPKQHRLSDRARKQVHRIEFGQPKCDCNSQGLDRSSLRAMNPKIAEDRLDCSIQIRAVV
ncbi:MAG: hypothetical protein ACKOAU_14795, partial [Pirellula sp.]